MRASDIFPSKYVKADDLQKDVTVTIKSVVIETLDTDKRPVMYFKGTDKGLVLNKTNFSKCAEICDSGETDEWPGNEVTLFRAMVEFKGDTVPAVRIKAPPRRQAPARDRPAPPPTPQHADNYPDDEIPF